MSAKQTIWKYQLLPAVIQDVWMQEGATILALQMQNDNPCIWAMVDPDAYKLPRRLYIYGTGTLLPEQVGTYIGTFQQHGYVFHVFEEVQP